MPPVGVRQAPHPMRGSRRAAVGGRTVGILQKYIMTLPLAGAFSSFAVVSDSLKSPRPLSAGHAGAITFSGSASCYLNPEHGFLTPAQKSVPEHFQTIGESLKGPREDGAKTRPQILRYSAGGETSFTEKMEKRTFFCLRPGRLSAS